jgi:hypothetical protein
MIPEYKFYHGAVLAELIDVLEKPVAVEELMEDGRLTSYVLDAKIGLHIKHSTKRLNPWQFTFTPANTHELGLLQFSYRDSFVVLVCHTDGMVCLTVDEVQFLLSFGLGDQASIRASRHRNELYTVSSGSAELPRKKPIGLGPIAEMLCS